MAALMRASHSHTRFDISGVVILCVHRPAVVLRCLPARCGFTSQLFLWRVDGDDKIAIGLKLRDRKDVVDPLDRILKALDRSALARGLLLIV
jgi:hypothetical protein